MGKRKSYKYGTIIIQWVLILRLTRAVDKEEKLRVATT